jgi:hypothetical protein
MVAEHPRQILFERAAALSDCVFAISEFAHTDFESFYGRPIPMRVISGGTSHSQLRDVARQYIAAFREVLAKNVDLDRLRARWATLRMLESTGAP